MAKFGIALGSGPRGLGFESRYSDHKSSRFWSAKVPKTVVFIEQSFNLIQTNPPAVRDKSDPKTAFDPDLTQTGTFSWISKYASSFRGSTFSVFRKVFPVLFRTGNLFRPIVILRQMEQDYAVWRCITYSSAGTRLPFWDVTHYIAISS